MGNSRRAAVLSQLDPASSLAIGLLILSFILLIAFEASNGFHDTANAAAVVRKLAAGDSQAAGIVPPDRQRR